MKTFRLMRGPTDQGLRKSTRTVRADAWGSWRYYILDEVTGELVWSFVPFDNCTLIWDRTGHLTYKVEGGVTYYMAGAPDISEASFVSFRPPVVCFGDILDTLKGPGRFVSTGLKLWA